MHAQRRIRSFVLRAGRVTVGQERALQDLWPVYGIDVGAPRADPEGPLDGAAAAAPIDLDAAFGHAVGAARRPRCLEIGFGAGEVISALAQAHPEIDYVGIEVHRSGVGRLLLNAEQAKLTNLKVICHDAVEVLRTALAGPSFDEILVFFPDPWHKKRHHKRRLIDASFVELLARRLRPAGILRLATDWQSYAAQMLEVCNAERQFTSLSADRRFVDRPQFRPPTRFERRGARLGHAVWDLAYQLTQEAAADAIDDELHGQRGEHDAG